MITSPVVPAVIPESLEDLVRQVNVLRGLPEIHVDVVDGAFVPSISWPYKNSDDVTEAKDLLSVFSLEVDLMVKNPIEAAQEWVKAGADQLIFHIETIDVDSLTKFVFEHDVTIGVAISIPTLTTDLYKYLAIADYIQVMGIEKIGYQGQSFSLRAIDKIKQIKQEYPNMPISIDGSVNATTLPQLAEFNLSRYIMGSAIVHTDNPKEAYLKFNQQLKELTS